MQYRTIAITSGNAFLYAEAVIANYAHVLNGKKVESPLDSRCVLAREILNSFFEAFKANGLNPFKIFNVYIHKYGLFKEEMADLDIELNDDESDLSGVNYIDWWFNIDFIRVPAIKEWLESALIKSSLRVNLEVIEEGIPLYKGRKKILLEKRALEYKQRIKANDEKIEESRKAMDSLFEVKSYEEEMEKFYEEKMREYMKQAVNLLELAAHLIKTDEKFKNGESPKLNELYKRVTESIEVLEKA